MFFHFICVVCFLSSLIACQRLPEVQIPSGNIEGTFDETISGRKFHSFEGIPYATPPVDQLRFKDAIPPKRWNGTWKANTKHMCLQDNRFAPENDNIQGSEDCLYLNVYTPLLDANLDVIVYIHGGAFMSGVSTKYLPHILLDRDVIYVSMNYRLGVLGFFCTEDQVVPGNNGLRDQILALRWVKENIKYFGGNPDSITLTGMSAGATSVHFHLLSPKSRGLFNRAMSMSACMLNPSALMEKPLERSKALASIVGCDTDDVNRMVDCLRERPAEQIVSAVRNFQPWHSIPFTPFGLVVDSWSTDPALPEHPLKLLRDGSVYDVPLLLSHTSGEGLYPGYDFFDENNLRYLDEHWDELIPHILDYNYTIETSAQKDANSKIRREYFGEQPFDRQIFNKLVDLFGDRLFKVDIDKCTRLHAAAIKSPVFHYLFDYRGAHSWTEQRTGTTENLGVSHGDDTPYILKSAVDTQSTEEDRNISKIMVDLYVTFAKYGEPRIGINWPEVSKNTKDPIKYLRISSSQYIEEKEEFGNRKFWDSLPFQENERLFTVRDEL